MTSEIMISDRLAAFADSLQQSQIPPEVWRRAKLLTLDAIGAAYAASGCDFAQKTLSALSALGSGDSQIIGMPVKLALRDAVMLNSVMVHGLDYDDTYLPGSVHLTASCVPAALGMAAHIGASGSDFMLAALLGLEIDARLGIAGNGGFLRAGFHATSILGTFACSLIAGRLLKLNRKQLAMAQGIALSTASGNMQPMEDGSWTKRIHPGWAAAGGITAAMLAREGFIGPIAPYEGRFGLYPCFLGKHAAAANPQSVDAEIGQRWEFIRSSIKLFPACHQAHAFMNAALKLSRAHAIDADQVESFHVLIAEPAVPLICEPLESKRRPDSSYAAQFSLPYAIASCLKRGKFGLPELEEPSYTDPALRALAQRMTYAIDPDPGFPKFRSGEVHIKMRNGAKYKCREQVVPDEPASEAAIVDKFLNNAQLCMPLTRAEKLRDMILDVESLANTRMLAAELAGQ
jgi:2-methylcitrate dehydratase PrpD